MQFNNITISGGITVYPAPTVINITLGIAGSGTSSGKNGGTSTLTFGSTTLTANGGIGGSGNSADQVPGGTATGGQFNATGGTGGAASGATGAGGGGGMNGGDGGPYVGGGNGRPGGNPNDFQGFLAAWRIYTGNPSITLGVGGSGGSELSPTGSQNGGSSFGFGGGGGAGYDGGTGGDGFYNGGGGGGHGTNSLSRNGGNGGVSMVLMLRNNSQGIAYFGSISSTVTTSYTIPTGTTSLKIWLLGAGGGGGNAGGRFYSGQGGSAGGIAYSEFTF